MRRVTYALLSLALILTTSPGQAYLFRPGGGVGGIVPPIVYNTYYISPTGNDATCDGTTGNRCATANGVEAKNPSLKCGDTIIAGTGTYTQSHMTITSTPSCPTQNDVVMVKCETAFGCNGTTQIAIRASYWGIQGWRNTSTSQACFIAYPPNTSTVIGVVAFVNNIAYNCYGGGIISYNDGSGANPHGVGTMIAIGNLVYNSATQTNQCNSGIVNGNPVAFLAVGDQNYDAWNYSFHNVASSCVVGTANSDQSGLNIDTDDKYTGQQVFENNWACFNGGPGIELTTGDGQKNAGPILVRYNTLCNNQRSSALVASVATELMAGAPGVSGILFTIHHNLVQTNSTIPCGNGGATGACSSGMKFSPADVSAASLSDNNFLYNSNSGCGHAGCGMQYWGTASLCQSPHSSPVGPYSNQYFGTGNIGGCSGNSYNVSPVLTDTSEPAAVTSSTCNLQPDVLTCFATPIANLVSTATGSTSMGAQVAAPTDSFNKTTLLCHIYAEMPSTMFVSGGGPIPNRC